MKLFVLIIIGPLGTCYSRTECSNKGGNADGSCAGGFGVCCVFNTPCNSETSENGTYFSSPDSLSSVCSIMINPMEEDICQVWCTVLMIIFKQYVKHFNGHDHFSQELGFYVWFLRFTVQTLSSFENLILDHSAISGRISRTGINLLIDRLYYWRPCALTTWMIDI